MSKRGSEETPVGEKTPVDKPSLQKKVCAVRPDSSSAEPERPEVAPSTSHASPSAVQDLSLWLNEFKNLSDSNATQPLDALLTCCSTGQVQHLKEGIKLVHHWDFISLLPRELALKILGYLSPNDLRAAAQTAKSWKVLAGDTQIWKDQCKRNSIQVAKIPKCRQLLNNQWKFAYMKQYLTASNWIYKSVKHPLVVRAHDGYMITCLELSGSLVVTGSDDCTLKIWSTADGKCQFTLRGHTAAIECVQIFNSLVVSGSVDGTIRFWTTNSGRCYRLIFAHGGSVRCMHLCNNKILVSGSRDRSVRVWSIPSAACIQVLRGHHETVRCVHYDQNVVISASYDRTVKVWNPLSGECLRTLFGHTMMINNLKYDGVRIVTSSLGKNVRSWDAATGRVDLVISNASRPVSMDLQSNILVTGHADSTLNVINLATGQFVHKLTGPRNHTSAITGVQMIMSQTDSFVVTGSRDGTVKLWDLYTGQYIRDLVEPRRSGATGVIWHMKASADKLVCAYRSDNGSKTTKLVILDFEVYNAIR